MYQNTHLSGLSFNIISMYKPLVFKLLFSFALLWFFPVSQAIAAGTPIFGTSAKAQKQEKKELVIGVGNFEPFFMKDGSGLFLDLLKELTALMPQYKVTFQMMSNYRLHAEIDNGRIDVACNIFPAANINAWLSEPFFRFTDVAVTRNDKNIALSRIADMQHYRVIAYQGAVLLLGDEYKEMAAANPGYKEHHDVSATSKMLVLNRFDVRVGDINLFYHDLQKHPELSPDDFTIHYFWPDVFSHLAFKDKALRDEFNQAINTLKSNGTWDRMYRQFRQNASWAEHVQSPRL